MANIPQSTGGAAPWWSYPRIDNFGTIDPAGPYWKPDSNIQIPGYYPIVNLLPGTVTSVQKTSWGQTVVTVALDTPINTLATHQFYEHMSSASVQVGQHLNSGDLVGYNNPPGQVPLGYGFYTGDVYGSGSAWTTLQNDLCPGCANLLNPVALLNAMKNGGSVPTAGGVPAPAMPASTFFNQIGQRIGLFILSLVLIGAGMYITFTKQINHAVGSSVKTAVKVAA